MTPSKQELEAWDRKHVWHSFTQMSEYEPLIIESAEGCELIDVDGRRFIDGVASVWCNVHGHAHPVINAAMRAQMDRVSHVTSLGLSNPTTIQLAKELCELAPAGLEHAFFSGDGSSAVEVAIKLALQYWRQREDPRPLKTKYVAFENAYHGDTVGSVSVGGVARFHAMFQPLLFETIRRPAPDLYRRPAGETERDACERALAALDAALERSGDEIAAVVLEPIAQCAAGMLVHPQGFLQGVRERTRRHDVLLIADEVAVGFGRTGTMFACEQESTTPDFLCLGKGLTGGYAPMAATLTTPEVWNAFLGEYAESKSFFHGHTFSGNPLCASAALASLRLFRDESTLERLQPKIQLLRSLLEPLRELPHVGDVRQAGLLAGIELVRDCSTKEPFAWEERRGLEICSHAMAQGVWLRPLGNVVVIMPPLAIEPEQLERIVKAVEYGLAQTFPGD